MSRKRLATGQSRVAFLKGYTLLPLKKEIRRENDYVLVRAYMSKYTETGQDMMNFEMGAKGEAAHSHFGILPNGIISVIRPRGFIREVYESPKIEGKEKSRTIWKVGVPDGTISVFTDFTKDPKTAWLVDIRIM